MAAISNLFGFATLVVRSKIELPDEEFLSLIAAAADPDDLADERYFRPSRKVSHMGGRLGRSSEPPNGQIAPRLRNHTRLPLWGRKLGRMLRALTKKRRIALSGPVREQIVEPAIEYAREELRLWLRRRRFQECAVITSSFERQLRRTLLLSCETTIDLRLRSLESAAYSLSLTHLQPNIEEPDRVFAENYGAHMSDLFRSFPALARIWSDVIRNWVNKVGELTARLERDRRMIAKVFFENQNPGVIQEVKCDVSDPHLGGRETIILSFDRGSIVYKPRAGHNEEAWFSLLRLINRQGFSPQFRTLSILLRGRYCWVEFVRARPCESRLEAKNYYRRAGGLICVTYLMGSIDCHCDNLIAAGEQPVLIDAETLLHRESEMFGYGGAATLLRSGLLPVPQNGRQEGYQVSALGGVIVGSHLPTLEGQIVPLSAHSADVTTGFEDMWNLIGKRQARTRSAFRRKIRQMRTLRWRRVCFPTSKYLEMRDASLHPAALQSGVTRWRTIELQADRRSATKSILKAEIRALMRLDIPYFTERPPANSVLSAAPPLSETLNWIKSTLSSP